MCGPALNRTTMELKLDPVRCQRLSASSLNRTTMELKHGLCHGVQHDWHFESNHYGIETVSIASRKPLTSSFESNHYGIETILSAAALGAGGGFESNHYGIETRQWRRGRPASGYL